MNVRRATGLAIPALAFAAVAVLVVLVAVLISPSPGPEWVHAGSLERINEKGVSFLPRDHVFVVAHDSQPIALSEFPPHLPGDTVIFCRRSGWFEEPQHGSKFNRYGDYQLGPASGGLDRVAVRVLDGEVWVYPDAITQGRPRGYRTEEGTDPEGPFCA
ncbi:MAG: hypothetical protein WD276_09445 [Actinomycetota bacterium]